MKMLGTKPFLQPCNSTAFTQFSPYLITSSIPLIPNKPHKTNFLFLQGRNGVFVSAAKKQKKDSKSLMDLDDFDEVYDEEDDEEEEGVFIPLSGMTEWFEKKPSGFGEGKEYDTSLEDKLLEELEQSRKAQLANINNLKNNPSMISSKKEQQVTKAVEPVPTGLRVRVGNLPKKKNILRDLQLVFKGFPAIVNISPAVSGNKKTRDPICKGFAFVDLGSLEAANRFVQTYSKKSITFGKIQKQITCEIANPTKSSDAASKHLNHNYVSTPGQRLPRMEEDSSADFDVDAFSLESRKVTPSGASDVDGFTLELREVTPSGASGVDGFSLESREVTPSGDSGVQSQQLVSVADTLEEGIAHINLSEMNDNENTRPTIANKNDSSPLKQQQKKRAIKKKQTVKVKSDKSPKLTIPGSSKRLRVKEKAVLVDVFSKYGSKASLTLTKER